MEQVRMAPLGAGVFVVGKTVPYFAISMTSAIGIIAASMTLFGMPMHGSWLLLLVAVSLFLVRRARLGSSSSSVAGDAAGRVSDRAGRVVPATLDAVRPHLPISSMRVSCSRDVCGAGAILPIVLRGIKC